MGPYSETKSRFPRDEREAGQSPREGWGAREKLVLFGWCTWCVVLERSSDDSSCSLDGAHGAGLFKDYRKWEGECSNRNVKKGSGVNINWALDGGLASMGDGLLLTGPVNEAPSKCSSLEGPLLAHLNELELAFVRVGARDDNSDKISKEEFLPVPNSEKEEEIGNGVSHGMMTRISESNGHPSVLKEKEDLRVVSTKSSNLEEEAALVI
ncbi:hypothetical protein Q3G72_032618 [Acer saccharum]|nr:hypothetical protein Q3G72_032618 [Acer saccharum]